MELMNEGLFLMIIGMGSVFAFLVIMLFTMHISSKVLVYLNKYFPEQKEDSKNKVQKTDKEAEIAVAIACAAKKMKGNCL